MERVLFFPNADLFGKFGYHLSHLKCLGKIKGRKVY